MLEGRDWHAATGASVDAIEELQTAAPICLPNSFLRLLLFSNGGEGPLPVNPYYFQLDAAQEVKASIASGNHDRPDLEGFLIFGSNGGGEYLALDTRKGAPCPVVTIDMIAGADSAEVIAPDFDNFIELIGVECPQRGR
jgi:hypothetical protein